MAAPHFSPNPATGHALDEPGTVPSPALLVYPDRVEANIRKMLEIAGGTTRLRPHVKTHKLAEVVQLQQAAGINKFKCATVAEAELLGKCGAADVVLAYQPVGPNVKRFTALVRQFPPTKFSTVVDNRSSAESLAQVIRTEGGRPVSVFVDIDCGMGRSGIRPGPAFDLYRHVASLAELDARGLHVYDGHIRDSDLTARTAHCRAEWAGVGELVDRLRKDSLAPPTIVAGGSPTFPVHAAHLDRELSPGTCLFWDAGYATGVPDLAFEHAAFVLTRVVSKPGDGNRLCLDLGHKAIAAENPIEKRVRLLGLEDVTPVSQSEEHFVIEARNAGAFDIGDVVYGVPWHICPTVALYDRAHVVRGGTSNEVWEVSARSRSLTI